MSAENGHPLIAGFVTRFVPIWDFFLATEGFFSHLRVLYLRCYLGDGIYHCSLLLLCKVSLGQSSVKSTVQIKSHWIDLHISMLWKSHCCDYSSGLTKVNVFHHGVEQRCPFPESSRESTLQLGQSQCDGGGAWQSWGSEALWYQTWEGLPHLLLSDFNQLRGLCWGEKQASDWRFLVPPLD